MLKNSKVVLFVTLKSWSGRKLLDPATYIYRLNILTNCVYEQRGDDNTYYMHFVTLKYLDR